MRRVISGKDDTFLSEMLSYRNALAHGFNAGEIAPGLVGDLIQAAKILRQEVISPSPSEDSAESANPGLFASIIGRNLQLD